MIDSLPEPDEGRLVGEFKFPVNAACSGGKPFASLKSKLPADSLWHRFRRGFCARCGEAEAGRRGYRSRLRRILDNRMVCCAKWIDKSKTTCLKALARSAHDGREGMERGYLRNAPFDEGNEMRRIFVGSVGLMTLFLSTVQIPAVSHAETPARMMQECRIRAGEVLRTRLPNVETKYEGQRTDGTHAVNGTARFDGRTETFQCSFNRAGRRIINFVVNQPSGSSPARPQREPRTRTERIRFERGANGITLEGSLGSGDSVRYILRARNRQFLSVELQPQNRRTHFNIFTPKNTTLYESAKAKNAYLGQLYLDGDHVVEVYNVGRRRTSYRVKIAVTNR